MKKLLDEAIYANEQISEEQLIDKVASELREGVSSTETIESMIIDIVDDLPFGLSKLSFFNKFYRHRQKIAFKVWENYNPLKARIMVGDILNRYKNKLYNGDYDFFDSEDMNFTVNQVKYINDREYLNEIEYYLPDYEGISDQFTLHTKQIERFLEIYKTENKCYVMIDSELEFGLICRTVDGDYIKISKSIVSAYYGEATDSTGKFIGTVIACVEGEEIAESSILDIDSIRGMVLRR